MSGRFTVETRFNAVDNTSGVIGAIEKRVNAMQRSVSGASRFVDKGFGAIKQVGAAAVGFGVAGGFLAKNIIDAGAGFEATMSGVAAVSGATDAEFAKLQARAIQLGSTSKYTSTEVAGAFEIMAKAGLKVDDILAGAPGLLSAAAADGAGVEDTANSLMSSMKAMGIAPAKMQLFADEMAKAGDSTAASVGSISESLAIAGPVFKQLNVPMESAIAQLALLQDAGIDASSSGTTLAATYSKLAAPMGRTAGAIAKLGLHIKDAQGNMKPPDQLMGEILGSTSKIKGNVGQMAAFTELVGLESQKALLNVASAARDGRLRSLVTDLQSAGGYADMIAAKRLDNFTGDVTLLENAVNGLSVRLFNMESGPLRGVVQDMTSWVRANEDLILSGVGEKVKEWTPLVIGFSEGLRDGFKELVPVMKGVAEGLGSVFGNNGSGQGPQAQAYFLAKNLMKCGEAFAIFALGTKVASIGVGAIDGVIKGAKVVGWMWDLGKSTKTAIDAFRVVGEVGPSGIVSLGNAINGIAGPVSKVGDATLAAEGGITGLAKAAGAAGAVGGPLLALAGAITGVVSAGYNLYALSNESGGLMGVGEDLAGGVWGAFGSGTKSWGVNGFLEGYAKNDDDRRNLEAARAFKGDAPKWTDKSAANAASDLTGFGRGYGRTPNDYAGAFGIMPAGAPVARPPGPYADAYAMPAAPAPQLTPRRDSGSSDQARTNQLLQDTIKQMVPQFAAAMKGTLTINMPKGATADVAGAPGVVVNQSGSF